MVMEHRLAFTDVCAVNRRDAQEWHLSDQFLVQIVLSFLAFTVCICVPVRNAIRVLLFNVRLQAAYILTLCRLLLTGIDIHHACKIYGQCRVTYLILITRTKDGSASGNLASALCTCKHMCIRFTTS